MEKCIIPNIQEVLTGTRGLLFAITKKERWEKSIEMLQAHVKSDDSFSDNTIEHINSLGAKIPNRNISEWIKSLNEKRDKSLVQTTKNVSQALSTKNDNGVNTMNDQLEINHGDNEEIYMAILETLPFLKDFAREQQEYFLSKFLSLVYVSKKQWENKLRSSSLYILHSTHKLRKIEKNPHTKRKEPSVTHFLHVTRIALGMTNMYRKNEKLLKSLKDTEKIPLELSSQYTFETAMIALFHDAIEDNLLTQEGLQEHLRSFDSQSQNIILAGVWAITKSPGKKSFQRYKEYLNQFDTLKNDTHEQHIGKNIAKVVKFSDMLKNFSTILSGEEFMKNNIKKDIFLRWMWDNFPICTKLIPDVLNYYSHTDEYTVPVVKHSH